ncbi:MAG: CRISPR-associated endonuclease Cas1, partial [Thaumarchaeota archaeon]|nr:CRISPR-associated endonuclease Cas1 [Nitrososphaerota archaeon]
MNPLLISGFGTSINVEKSKLIIQNKLNNTKYEFYPHKINHDNIILDNHSGNITFDAIKWLLKHDISLSILNWNGNLLGITLPESPKLGNLRIKQYQKYLDNKTRYKIAESIVFSKVQSSFNLLNNLSEFYLININKIKQEFEAEFSNYFDKLKKYPSFSNLLSYEGRVAQVYFDVLGTIFAKISPKFIFEARKGKENNRNYNAADEINALLNYGYAILESEIRKTVNSIGLDPTIGYLHEIYPSKTPLIYDIEELFRWIIDLSVIQLLNGTKLSKEDFILTENYNIRLKNNVAELLINKIKDNFNSKVPYNGKKYHYHNILSDIISKLAYYIADKNNKIEFIVPNIDI